MQRGGCDVAEVCPAGVAAVGEECAPESAGTEARGVGAQMCAVPTCGAEVAEQAMGGVARTDVCVAAGKAVGSVQGMWAIWGQGGWGNVCPGPTWQCVVRRCHDDAMEGAWHGEWEC